MDNLKNDEILSMLTRYKETGSDEIFDAIADAYTPLMAATAAKLSLDFEDKVRERNLTIDFSKDSARKIEQNGI